MQVQFEQKLDNCRTYSLLLGLSKSEQISNQPRSEYHTISSFVSRIQKGKGFEPHVVRKTSTNEILYTYVKHLHHTIRYSNLRGAFH